MTGVDPVRVNLRGAGQRNDNVNKSSQINKKYNINDLLRGPTAAAALEVVTVSAGVAGAASSVLSGGIFSLFASLLSIPNVERVRCRLLGVSSDLHVVDVSCEQLDATVELELLRARFPSTVALLAGIAVWVGSRWFFVFKLRSTRV